MYAWRSIYISECLSFRTRIMLMVDYVRRGIWGVRLALLSGAVANACLQRDLSKVSLLNVSGGCRLIRCCSFETLTVYML
jgi:hypothetical protein